MDIKSIADLINGFVLAEAEILNQQKIKHPTTIGAMYEGLTAEVIEKSIFEGLNLKIVKNSFILGCDTEFDVLLVEGEGQEIPKTGRFIYHPEKIIAIISVKKNLYSSDIEDAYNNLQFIINYFEKSEPDKFIGRLFRDSFRQICRKDINALEKGELSENEEFIFHTLRLEAFLPLRIVWGYNGFKSEFSFRNSFYKYLAGNITKDNNSIKKGFSPLNFPNLIICEKYSMFKSNGMPFAYPLQKENWWPFYFSSTFNPMYYFLELIWTRLSYKYELPSEIFGEDLDIMPANEFLDCKLVKKNALLGWEYNNNLITNQKLKTNSKVIEWHPIVLDISQFIIINQLCKRDELDIRFEINMEAINKDGLYISLTDFLEKLKATGLVYIENYKLKLLTDQCQCAILPNGKFVADENKSGRFINWVNKELRKIQS